MSLFLYNSTLEVKIIVICRSQSLWASFQTTARHTPISNRCSRPVRKPASDDRFQQSISGQSQIKPALGREKWRDYGVILTSSFRSPSSLYQKILPNSSS